MFHRISAAVVLSLVFCTVDANAATYCAKFVGGPERVASGDRGQCDFATLKECRAAVRARGGGTCHKMAHPTEPGRLR